MLPIKRFTNSSNIVLISFKLIFENLFKINKKVEETISKMIKKTIGIKIIPRKLIITSSITKQIEFGHDVMMIVDGINLFLIILRCI